MPKERTPLREIPVINLEDFGAGGVRRDEFTDLAMRALHDIGFAYVKTPDDILENVDPMHESFKKLFDLPEEVKKSYERTDIGHQRGYTPIDTETGILCKATEEGEEDRPNHAENWFVGPEISKSNLLYKEFPWAYEENIWPEEVPELKDRIDPIYSGLYRMGRTVLASLEEGMGLDSGYFDAMTQDSPTVFRPLHYPAVAAGEARDEKVIGACNHTDINLLTVLPAPTRDGLYVQTRSGLWVSGNSAPPGHLIIQIGDMLERITGGYFMSAEHKVLAPLAQTENDKGRYSSALFVHARSNYPLAVIERLADHPEDYSPIRAADFLKQRLIDIGVLGKE